MPDIQTKTRRSLCLSILLITTAIPFGAAWAQPAPAEPGTGDDVADPEPRSTTVGETSAGEPPPSTSPEPSSPSSPPEADGATTQTSEVETRPPAAETHEHPTDAVRSSEPDAPAPKEPEALGRPPTPVRVADIGAASMLWRRRDDGGQAGWVPLCAPPCEFAAPKWPTRYGLSPAADQRRVRDAGTLWVGPGDGIEADVRSRRRVRAVGAGLVAAAALALVPALAASDAGARGHVGRGTLPAVGAVLTTGVVMLLIRDRASVKRCPGCAGR